MSGPVLQYANAKVNEINIVPALRELTAIAEVLSQDGTVISLLCYFLTCPCLGLVARDSDTTGIKYGPRSSIFIFFFFFFHLFLLVGG